MESTTAGGYNVLAVLDAASAPSRAMETPPLGNNAPLFLVRVEISAQIQISSVPARPMRSVSANYKLNNVVGNLLSKSARLRFL